MFLIMEKMLSRHYHTTYSAWRIQTQGILHNVYSMSKLLLQVSELLSETLLSTKYYTHFSLKPSHWLITSCNSILLSEQCIIQNFESIFERSKISKNLSGHPLTALTHTLWAVKEGKATSADIITWGCNDLFIQWTNSRNNPETYKMLSEASIKY